MNDNHYTESKEDWQKRIFRASDRHQYKEDHADDERDADFDKKVKVVMVTALDEQERMDEACKLGACEYITKPLILDNLEHAVEKNLK